MRLRTRNANEESCEGEINEDREYEYDNGGEEGRKTNEEEGSRKERCRLLL